MSRKLSELSPRMLDKCISWKADMDKASIAYIITCTGRLQVEQNVLYAQGRTAPGRIVTWTLNSKHLYVPPDQLSDAFDFVIMVGGKPDWAMEHSDLWKEAVAIGNLLGLSQVIGRNGKVLEYAHLQWGE